MANETQVTATPGNGASKAADFQPTTQNPQSEAGVIQQNGDSLQPAPGQTGLSQQDLPSQVGLEVVSPATTGDVTVAKATFIDPFVWGATIFLLLLGVITVMWLRRKYPKTAPETPISDEGDNESRPPKGRHYSSK